jgi:riboflavin kinase/FMN adenylyltransferase
MIETMEFKKRPVLALGTFDGLHPGHRAVIAACAQKAAEAGLCPAVYTFRENPKALFGQKPLEIMPWEDKVARLLMLGMQTVICERFTRELSLLSPEEFVDCLCRKYSPAAFVCGEDYTFGAKGSGSALTLKQLAGQRGIDTVIMPLVTVTLSPDAAPVKISSTLLRELKQSDIKRQI